MKNRIAKTRGDVGGHPHPQIVNYVSGKRTSTKVDMSTSVDFNHFGKWAKLISLIALMLILVACGGAAPEAPAEPEIEEEVAVAVAVDEAEAVEEEEPEAEAAMDMAMVTVAHPSGELTVAQSPETVVVFNYSALDTLDALGIPVAGVPQGPLMPPHLEKYNGDGYVNVGSFFEPDFEAVNALDPDLIIVGGRSVRFYEDMAKIGPTLDVTGDWEDRLGTLEAYVTNIGVIFDQEAEVADALDDINAHIAQVQAMAEASGEEALIVLTSGGEVSAYGPGSRFGFIHDLLGVAATDSKLTPETHGDTISNEFILEQNPGILFVVDRDAAIGAEEGEAAAVILDNELVNETPAAQNGHIVYLHPQNWYLADAGLTTFDAMISDVESAFGASVAAGAFPVTIEHQYGATTIEAKPERVVSIGYNEQDPLLALGAKPLAVRYWYGEAPNAIFPWAQDEAAGLEPIVMNMPYGELNYEQILALEPDFISAVYSGITEEEYELLSQIAPTLAQDGAYEPFGMPWQEVTQSIGQALGESDTADRMIAEVQNTLEEAIAANPEFAGKTVVAAYANGDGTYGYYSSQDVRSRFFTDLGFIIPEELDEFAAGGFYAVVSQERVDLLDRDLIVFLGIQFLEGGVDTILNDPIINQLDAMKEGRYVIIPNELDDAFQFNSVLSLEYLIEGLAPELATGLNGGVAMEAAEKAETSEDVMAAGASALPRTVTDYEGNQVVIEDDSVLIPIDGPLTEIVYALGMGDKVVAADSSSTYPAEVADLPQVGYVRRLSAEPVLALAPTLILTTDDAGPPEAVDQLKESGVTVVQFKAATTVEESMQLVRDVAAALGVDDRGEDLVAKMESDLEEAAELLAQADTTPRVMMIYARGVDTVSAAGYGTSVDVMFELAGVENAVTEWEGYQPLTAEGAVTVAPDALLLFDSGLASVGGPSGLVEVPGIAETPAGADMNIHSMDGLLLTGLGPRVGEAVQDLIMMLHPELAGESSMRDGDLTVEHDAGTTTISGVPERIVVLEYSYADHLGVLDVDPVGYAVDSMPDYLLAFTEDVGATVVGTRAEPNLEEIVALNPDLIIGDLRRHEAIYAQLSEIAPTLILNSLRGSYEDQLAHFETIAEIMDKEAEAAAILNEYQAAFEETAASTNSDAGDFIIGVLWSGGFSAHSNESFMGSFLESLGRTNALEPVDGETQYALDMEGFASINPSTIVILCSEADQAVLDEMQADPLWQAFDAVKNNRVYVFNRNLWSKGRGVMAFESILNDSVESGLLGDTESNTLVCS